MINLILTVLFVVALICSLVGIFPMAWPNVCIAYLASLAVAGNVPLRGAS